MSVPAPALLAALSLHDALPIWPPGGKGGRAWWWGVTSVGVAAFAAARMLAVHTPAPGTWLASWRPRTPRSEEHTSELQSLTNLVCRLLLEKQKYPRMATYRSNT